MAERTQSWLVSNWKMVAVALIAIGATGATVYALSRNAKDAPLDDVKSVSASKSKKKKKKRSPKISSEGTVVDEKQAAESTALTSPEEIKAKALEIKALGNQLYAQKNYEEAIQQYTKAIELLPNAVFYCNRAACYSNMGDHNAALKDCDEAIKLDSKYIKAFHRRALAFEKLGEDRAALNEYTIVCALENFKNQNSMIAPDRLLKVIAGERAAKIMKDKVAIMPSDSFISAYMNSFRAKPSNADVVSQLAGSNVSDGELLKVFEFAKKGKWVDSLNAVTNALEKNDFSVEKLKAIALNYRGTIYFLMGKVDDAVEDLDNSLILDPSNVETIIKRGTLYMERGDIEKTIEQLGIAERLAPKHPDLFYQRGQVRFLTGDFTGAVEDYTASLENETPEESSVYVHIQLGVAKYKVGDVVGAEKKFREAKKAFPESAEVWNYHGEILLDKQSFNEG
jgi:import receptor subunit TOM70